MILLTLNEKVAGKEIKNIKTKSLMPNVVQIQKEGYVQIEGFLELRIIGDKEVFAHDFLFNVAVPNQRAIKDELGVKINNFNIEYREEIEKWEVEAEVELMGIKEKDQ